MQTRTGSSLSRHALARNAATKRLHQHTVFLPRGQTAETVLRGIGALRAVGDQRASLIQQLQAVAIKHPPSCLPWHKQAARGVLVVNLQGCHTRWDCGGRWKMYIFIPLILHIISMNIAHVSVLSIKHNIQIQTSTILNPLCAYEGWILVEREILAKIEHGTWQMFVPLSPLLPSLVTLYMRCRHNSGITMSLTWCIITINDTFLIFMPVVIKCHAVFVMLCWYCLGCGHYKNWITLHENSH